MKLSKNKKYPKLLVTLLTAACLSTLSFSSSWAQSDDFQTSLTGTWKSNCMNVGMETYIIITSVYSGAGVSNDRVVFYRGPSCTAPTGLVKTNSKVAYTVGKTTKKVGGMDVFPVTLTILSWQLTQNGSLVKSGGPVPTMFDIYSIKDNRLYNSGTTKGTPGTIPNPAVQPTALDMANYYTRQ